MRLLLATMASLAVICGGAAAAQAPATTGWSLTRDVANPIYGDTVGFTGTYDQAARRQARTPQFPDNPNLDVNCTTDAGVHILFTTVVQSERKNADGTWTGVFYPLAFPGLNEFVDWPSNVGASCAGSVISFAEKKGQIVTTQYGVDFFYVQPGS